jgi:hypothetical protein
MGATRSAEQVQNPAYSQPVSFLENMKQGGFWGKNRPFDRPRGLKNHSSYC